VLGIKESPMTGNVNDTGKGENSIRKATDRTRNVRDNGRITTPTQHKKKHTMV